MHTRLLCCTASVAGKRKKKKEEFASASLLNLLLQPFCFFSSKTYEKKNSSLDFANLDICVVLRERENFRWNYILTNARSMLTRIQQQNIPNHNSEVHSECVWLYYFGAIFVVGRSYESSSFCWLVPFFSLWLISSRWFYVIFSFCDGFFMHFISLNECIITRLRMRVQHTLLYRMSVNIRPFQRNTKKIYDDFLCACH